MRPEQKKVSSMLGLIAAVASALFGKSPKTSIDDIKRADFKTSSQRIGVRFTDKIRNVFRSRWLKKS
ncbi:MAG: hypothetical protein DRP65_08560 [Planctomycetota bacterium]|nr:MAG: hypothetical protein DRP65_08560 [Planctomycetota bacterium]